MPLVQPRMRPRARQEMGARSRPGLRVGNASLPLLRMHVGLGRLVDVLYWNTDIVTAMGAGEAVRL